MKPLKLFIICTLLFFSCNPDKEKQVDPENAKSATTDSSELFFKNVRQLYYDKTTHEPSKLEQYRFGERVQTNEKPIINLCIVHNWRQDAAYILIEPNEFLVDQERIEIEWANPKTQETGTASFTAGPQTLHFAFATQLYNLLLEGCQFKVKINDEWQPILQDENEREAFRITLIDFYRLVNVL